MDITAIFGRGPMTKDKSNEKKKKEQGRKKKEKLLPSILLFALIKYGLLSAKWDNSAVFSLVTSKYFRKRLMLK